MILHIDESVLLLSLNGNLEIHFGTRTRQTTFHHLSSHISLRYITAGVEYCLFVPRSSRTSIQIGNRLHTFFFDGLLPESGIYNISYDENCFRRFARGNLLRNDVMRIIASGIPKCGFGGICGGSGGGYLVCICAGS